MYLRDLVCCALSSDQYRCDPTAIAKDRRRVRFRLKKHSLPLLDGVLYLTPCSKHTFV